MNAFSRPESHRLSAQRGGTAASHTGMCGALVIDRRYSRSLQDAGLKACATANCATAN